jgi:catechol 2,3-dioxygenase-like lactoylglutathione lyase family enzyme
VYLESATLIVDDYDRAIEFFVGALGFELVEDSPALTSTGDRPKRWVLVRPPGQRTGLLLAQAEGPKQLAAVGRQVAARVGWFLRVGDFDATFERFRAAGVEFEGAPRSEPYGRVVVFRDVAGNRWDLLGPTEPESTRKEPLRAPGM